MFTLVRKNDGLILEKKYFQNIRYVVDENGISNFPPEVGCSAVVFDSMNNYWQTTLIRKVLKLSDNKYRFFTQNSQYDITKTDNG